MENKCMFILCPPASGSTLLHKILQTSPHTSGFNVEGQALVPTILFTKDRWNPAKVIPWDIVKQKWFEKWDLQKAILLEKSPPNLIRAQQLVTHFPNSYFVIMIRNPYAFCEGVKRRWGRKFSYLNIARLWSLCAGYQINNIQNLKNAIWFTYEDLTTNTGPVCRKIIDFVPELNQLYPDKKFAVFEKSMNIMNLNQTQISNLSDDDLFEINLVLKKYKDYLAFFNYEYIDRPMAHEKSKIMKTIYLRLRSLNHLPGLVQYSRSSLF